MNIQCLRCKGRGFCGRSFCMHYAKANAMFKVKEKINSSSFLSSAPSVFVGHVGYPYVNVGILSPLERVDDAWLYDAPRFWAAENFQIPQIIDYRSALVNSRFKVFVKQSTRFLDISQEIGMSSKPVDVEVNLEDKPKFRLNTDSYVAPTGPNAKLKKVEITSNPKISTKVDKVVSDTDLKANNALVYLSNAGFDENFLSRILSIGVLGLKKSRKLVPLRWSITATDDMIAKNMIDEIKQYNQINPSAFFGSYLGNYYFILMFPEVWGYELFETYLPKASWNITNKIQYTTDYELYSGRKTYAENCAGGYYSVRLAILEKLRQMRRQASVLALRFITGEYAVPLGVWVTREATRKALMNKIEFSDNTLMLEYARKLIKKRFNYDVDNLLKNSILLRNIKTQRKLNNY